jgi:putative ABC transport system permease protein
MTSSRLIQITLRSFFKKKESNRVKLFSLTIGFSIASVLLSKVYFEQTYDRFFPDGNRIYQVQGWAYNDTKNEASHRLSMSDVSGAIAPGMKADIPEVEAATRFTYLADQTVFHTIPDKTTYASSGIFPPIHT